MSYVPKLPKEKRRGGASPHRKWMRKTTFGHLPDDEDVAAGVEGRSGRRLAHRPKKMWFSM